MRPSEPRVVVVGGGFGGLYAAAYLARSELAERGASVVLIDRRNYFTFTPLLAEVAAGALGREHVTYPFRVLAKKYGFSFVQDELLALHPEERTIETRAETVSFDHLVLALGSEPQFYGNAMLEREGLPLATVDQALAVRARVMRALEGATKAEDERERERLLTFDVAKPFFPRLPEPRVVLVDSGERILTAWDEDLACRGLVRLRDREIDVRLETRIESVQNGLVTMRNGGEVDQVSAGALIWTAGTAPSPLATTLPLPIERGAIRVDCYLRVEGHERIFSIGDVTTLLDERSQRPYPRVAPSGRSGGREHREPRVRPSPRAL